MKRCFVLAAALLGLAACGGVPCSEHEASAKKSIYFEHNSDVISDRYARQLDDGLVYIKGHRFKKIQLDSYADETGTSGYNLNLSRRRASSVRNYMIGKGVAARRISIRPHGIEPGDPLDEHRRVDVTIVQ